MSNEPVDPVNPLSDEAARAFEQSLAQLRPAAPEAGRDNLMFAAGRHAALKKIRAWQGVSGLLATGWMITIVAWPAVLGLYAATPNRNAPTPSTPAPLVARQTPAPAATALISWQSEENPSASAPLGAQSYLSLRQAILARGVDAIPTPHTSAGTSLGNGDASLRNLQLLLAQPKGNQL